MAIADVLAQWPTYQMLLKATYTGINTPQTLNNVIANIGPFPQNDPGEWNNWVTSYGALVALDDAVEVTDAALKAFADFVAATNKLAAAVKLAAPNQQEVSALVNQLNVVNKAIQADQRFAAALKIGKSIAGAINSNLKK